MSVQSLQNGSLQLRELTVSNAYDSLATGYVAENTTITPDKITSPQITTDLLGIFSSTTTHPPVISTSNDNLNVSLYGGSSIQVAGTGGVFAAAITAGNTVKITNGVGSPNDVVLSCPQNDVLNVGGSVIATSVEILSSTGSVNLTAPVAGTLEVGGDVQCDAVGTPAVTLQNGANSTTLTASATTPNTLIVSGNLTVGSSISVPTYFGGIVAGRFTPPTPGAWNCAATAVTQIVLPAFNFAPSAGYLNCPYFFQVQTNNNIIANVVNYSITQASNQVTITIQVANAQATTAGVSSISVLGVNPSA